MRVFVHVYVCVHRVKPHFFSQVESSSDAWAKWRKQLEASAEAARRLAATEDVRDVPTCCLKQELHLLNFSSIIHVAIRWTKERKYTQGRKLWHLDQVQMRGRHQTHQPQHLNRKRPQQTNQ